MPSLLPPEGPGDLAAMRVTGAPVFLPGQRSRCPPCVHGATPGFAARYGLRGCAPTSVSARRGTWCFGLPGVPTQWVPSLELPGRAARSRSRTSTGEFQSIHGILSGTFFQLPDEPRAVAVYPSVRRSRRRLILSSRLSR